MSDDAWQGLLLGVIVFTPVVFAFAYFFWCQRLGRGWGYTASARPPLIVLAELLEKEMEEAE